MPQLPLWLLALLAAAAAALLVPFAPWILLALWLGIYARRIHEPLARKLHGRPRVAAVITVSLLLVIALPIAAVVTSIVVDAIALVQRLMESGRMRALLEQLVESGGGGSRRPLEATPESAIDLLRSQGDRALAIARQVAGAAAHFVIGLLIMVTGMYSVLTVGRGWWAWWERHAPIAPEQLRAFGAAFVETGRGLWWGVFGAGLLQAAIVTTTYVVLGVPSAFALGLLSLLASVVPAIGTAIVWVPVAAGLALTGRIGAAIALAVVGFFVSGTIDNIARPWLTRRGRLQLPTWLVLTSMFGGIELLGGWGVLYGPLALRLAKEALVLRRQPPANP